MAVVAWLADGRSPEAETDPVDSARVSRERKAQHGARMLLVSHST
jgi:hypothetical protein